MLIFLSLGDATTYTRHLLLFHSRSRSECAWREEERLDRHQRYGMTQGFYLIIDISIPERPKIIALVTDTRNFIDSWYKGSFLDVHSRHLIVLRDPWLMIKSGSRRWKIKWFSITRKIWNFLIIGIRGTNTPCLNIFKYWKIIDCSILILNLNILGILKIEEIFEKFTEYPSDPV